MSVERRPQSNSQIEPEKLHRRELLGAILSIFAVASGGYGGGDLIYGVQKRQEVFVKKLRSEYPHATNRQACDAFKSEDALHEGIDAVLILGGAAMAIASIVLLISSMNDERNQVPQRRSV